MSHFVRLGSGRAFSIACFSALALAAPATAHTGATAGGAGYDPPKLTGAACDTPGSDGGCPQGAQLRLKGENLKDAKAVVFLGRGGVKDDRTASPVKTSPHRVVVRVPTSARSGRIRVAADEDTAVGPRVAVAAQPGPVKAAVPTATAADGGVFPVGGKHNFGTAVNGFGGGRGHKGQDVFANCGTPVLSALPGKVTLAKWQDRAGNYAVIKADDGTSQAYMHMLEPAIVKKGARVAAGQQIGKVGETGRATGCHLHFELWTAPGWYEGGDPIDPLPALKSWDAAR